jgi:hypothetical protein
MKVIELYYHVKTETWMGQNVTFLDEDASTDRARDGEAKRENCELTPCNLHHIIILKLLTSTFLHQSGTGTSP